MNNRQDGITRRSLLKIVGSIGVLGLGGTAYVGSQLPNDYPDADHYKTINPHVLAVLTALAENWLPPVASGFPPFQQLPVFEHLDRGLTRLPAPSRELFLTGIAGFDYAAFAYGWHGKPFTELSPDKRAEYINRWFKGLPEQKALLSALRQLMLLSYWRESTTWPQTGYLGPKYLRGDIPALGDAPEPTA